MIYMMKWNMIIIMFNSNCFDLTKGSFFTQIQTIMCVFCSNILKIKPFIFQHLQEMFNKNNLLPHFPQFCWIPTCIACCKAKDSLCPPQELLEISASIVLLERSWNPQDKSGWQFGKKICETHGPFAVDDWLVVEPTHLKNISQNGNLPQFSGWK